jgi:NADPH2:quinone reductase
MGTQAIEVTRFGGPGVLALSSIPEPVAGPGQAVISVAMADVLFLDATIRSGRAAAWFPVRPPYVPGGGVGGRVSAIGAGVDPAWAGRAVIARTGAAGGAGGYAEQAAVPAGRLVAVPDGVDLAGATALLHDGATALGLAEHTGIRPTDWVLVLGAAGGLGLLLVQIARASGAQVVGAARGAAKLAVITEHGAAAAVDYTEPGWIAQVTAVTSGAGPDVVFDGVGGPLGEAASGLLAAGGRFSAHGAASGGFAVIDPAAAQRRGITVRGIEQVQAGAGEHHQLAQRALALLAMGRVRPVIGQTYPLHRAADAHAALEARTAIGKTLLTVGG